MDETEVIRLLERVRSQRTKLSDGNRLAFALQAKVEDLVVEGETLATMIENLGEHDPEGSSRNLALKQRHKAIKEEFKQLRAQLPSLLNDPVQQQEDRSESRTLRAGVSIPGFGTSPEV